MKPIGRLILFLLVAGLAFGGWQLYQRSGGKTPSIAIPGVKKEPVDDAPKNNDTARNDDTPRNTPAPKGSGTSLTLITSATKKGWLEAQVERFNAEKGGNVRIEYIETRDALQAILHGKQKPTLWSPSAPLWATRLS
ncbi:MAG: substrate-binding domain-containing protein, partial [Fibrella sp.]|nr:substrate-binding domain-containing protein [Armatimonadota bacterium]